VSAILRNIFLAGIAGVAALQGASVYAAGAHTPKVTTGSSDSSSDGALPTGRGALRLIVQQCVQNWQQHSNPAPCERVSLADPQLVDSGYALLEDPDGGAHYLLIPTKAMAGVDSSELLDPDSPNYFAEAWHARDLLGKFVGHSVPRTDIGLVINTRSTRTYDQFHIHIECLRADVAESLRALSGQMKPTWSPITVGGATFQAMQILGDGLDGSNLFETLASMKPDVAQHMGDYTLVAVGAEFPSGLGFILLTGTGPTGEFLLDSRCLVSGGGG
jgi:CDP-diacylglycerol pyrophosphatase